MGHVGMRPPLPQSQRPRSSCVEEPSFGAMLRATPKTRMMPYTGSRVVACEAQVESQVATAEAGLSQELPLVLGLIA